jgi:hypothetical protein
MAQYSGRSYVTCQHPEIDEESCEIRVNWTRYVYPGDRETPPEDDVDIDRQFLIKHNGKNVPRNTEIPDWVTYDQVMDGIDVNDYYDGNEN